MCGAARSGTAVLLCRRQAGSAFDTGKLACPASYLLNVLSAVRKGVQLYVHNRLPDMLRLMQEVADAIVQIYSRAAKFSQYVSTGLSGEYAVS